MKESVEELRSQDVGEQRKDGHHLKEEENTSYNCQRIRARKVV